MNERIKELTAQLGEPSTWGRERPVGPNFAGSRWSGWSDCQQELRGYNTPLYDTAQLKKFAELIVQECADTVTDRCEMRNESDVKRAEYYAKRIKEHFGVE